MCFCDEASCIILHGLPGCRGLQATRTCTQRYCPGLAWPWLGGLTLIPEQSILKQRKCSGLGLGGRSQLPRPPAHSGHPSWHRGYCPSSWRTLLSSLRKELRNLYVGWFTKGPTVAANDRMFKHAASDPVHAIQYRNPTVQDGTLSPVIATLSHLSQGRVVGQSVNRFLESV